MKIELFGTLPGESPVQLYTLSNKAGFRAVISDYGATLVAWEVPDATGHTIDVVMGYDTLEDYVKDEAYMGAICGRYANRIAKASLPLGDQHYELDRNHGNHTLHGGSPGFNKVVWKATDQSTADQDSVRFSYLSPHGEAGFPGNLKVTVTYTLEERGLRIDYHAETDQPTVVNLANHTYFNLGGHDSGFVLDHQLQLKATRRLETDRELIPTGKSIPVAGSPFDFLDFQRLGAKINAHDEALMQGSGYDHCFVIDDADESLRQVGTLTNGILTMDIHTTQPGIQVYTANHLSDVMGKGKAIYQSRHAVCLETQHFPDSPHHPHFPPTFITQHQPYKETVKYEFLS